MPAYEVIKAKIPEDRHMVDFSAKEIEEALMDFAAKKGINIPTGRVCLDGLNSSRRDQSKLTLTIYVPQNKWHQEG